MKYMRSSNIPPNSHLGARKQQRLTQLNTVCAAGQDKMSLRTMLFALPIFPFNSVVFQFYLGLPRRIISLQFHYGRKCRERERGRGGKERTCESDMIPFTEFHLSIWKNDYIYGKMAIKVSENNSVLDIFILYLYAHYYVIIEIIEYHVRAHCQHCRHTIERKKRNQKIITMCTCNSSQTTHKPIHTHNGSFELFVIMIFIRSFLASYDNFNK